MAALFKTKSQVSFTGKEKVNQRHEQGNFSSSLSQFHFCGQEQDMQFCFLSLPFLFKLRKAILKRKEYLYFLVLLHHQVAMEVKTCG